MNNNGRKSGGDISMILKVLAVMYLFALGIGFVKEYVFTRTDATSHTIGIIIGIVALAIAVPLVISAVKSVGKTRKYTQKTIKVKPVDYSNVKPGKKKTKHTGNTKNIGRKK